MEATKCSCNSCASYNNCNYNSIAYRSLDSEAFAKSFCNLPGINSYLLNYKLPQSVVVVPKFEAQSRVAQGRNRFIQSVQVAPISPSTMTVSLAAAAELTITGPYIVAGTSADVAVATVAISGTTATITAVAAGTTTVTITDGKKTVSTITVTVA